MSTQQKRVLVVDDDPVIGRSFKGVLSGKGYAVITAANGQEALDKINSENYDMVYTDIAMPGMSGIEVAQRIHNKQPWLPVVIITGFGSEENMKQAKAAGVSDFLNKPLSPEMIEQSAADALKKGEASLDLVLEAEPAAAQAVTVEVENEQGALDSVIVFPRNMKLLFTAPFAGLAQSITLPLLGLSLLATMGEQGLVKRGFPKVVAWFLTKAALYTIAPIIELAYLAALPLAGLGILAWMGWREVKKAFGLAAEEIAAESGDEEFSFEALREGAQKAFLRMEAAAEVTVASAKVEATPATAGDYLKHVSMLLTAPFIGLVYILTFPFIGLSTLAVMGAKEAIRLGVPKGVAMWFKNVALFVISPFIGLAYMLALPFVGLGLLAWMGFNAAKARFPK